MMTMSPTMRTALLFFFTFFFVIFIFYSLRPAVLAHPYFSPFSFLKPKGFPPPFMVIHYIKSFQIDKDLNDHKKDFVPVLKKNKAEMP